MKKKDSGKVIAAAVIVLVFIVVPIIGGVIFGGNHYGGKPHYVDPVPPEFEDKVDRCHKKGMKAGQLLSGGKVTNIKCYEE